MSLVRIAVVAVAVVAISARLFVSAAQASDAQATQHQIHRKSLVFDLKTPKVFYCPQEKPADPEKLIVKAQPLEKLCEFEGKHKPKNLPSDCYNDVDESEFACDEKKRFMIKLNLAGEVNSSEGIDDLDYIMTKSTSSKKKASPTGKKY